MAVKGASAREALPVDVPFAPAKPNAPTTDPAHWLGDNASFLGQGWVSKVWGNDEWVVKVGKELIPQANMMPAPDPLKRQALAAQTVQVIERLRKAPEFSAFRHLLPETYLPAPFVIVQRRQSGLKLSELKGNAAVVGARNRDALWTAAHAAIPGIEIDVNDGNVLYAPDGKLAGWYDPAGGGSWAADWNHEDPPGLHLKDACTALIEKALGTGRQISDSALVRIGGVYALPQVSDWSSGRQALLVPCLAANRAFAVEGPFLASYQSRGFGQTHGGEASNYLGQPIGAPANDGDGGTVQPFEFGGIRVKGGQASLELDPGLEQAIPLIAARWAEGGWKTVGPLLERGGGFARPMVGKEIQFGDALVIANPKLGRAFVVRHGFRYAYESTVFAETRGRPLDQVLGLPLEDEHESPAGSNRWEQRFEHGRLVWTQATETRVELK